MKKRRGFIALIGFLFLTSFLQGCNMPGWGKDDLAQIAKTQTMLASIADAVEDIN